MASKKGIQRSKAMARSPSGVSARASLSNAMAWSPRGLAPALSM
jgi:hypothetical protein